MGKLREVRPLSDDRHAGIVDRLSRGERLTADQLALRLPRPPDGVSFNDLGLDVRTCTALRNAGYAKNPISIGDLKIGEVLELPGFGRKCLEVLLHASGHWHDRKRHKAMRHPALDRIRSIQGQLRRGHLRRFMGERVPPLPPGLGLADLNLSTRTRNCFSSSGISDADKLREFTFGQLMQIHSFGRGCIEDILSAIEMAYAKAPLLWVMSTKDDSSARLAQAKELASRLACLLEEHRLSEEDVRYGSLLRKLGVTSSQELNERLREGQVADVKAISIVDLLLGRLSRAQGLTFEQEALDLRSIKKDSRNEKIVRAYFGFGDHVASTLEEIGEGFHLTRERVRQICSRKTLKARIVSSFQPVLQRVLAVIAANVPNSSATIEEGLVAQALIEGGTQIGEIARYCDAMAIPCSFKEIVVEGHRLAVYRHSDVKRQEVWPRAKRLAETYGATTAVRVCDDARRTNIALKTEEVEELLSLHPGFIKIDGDQTWYAAKKCGHRFARNICRVLVVAGELTIRELRGALRRDYRNGIHVPPTPVLSRAIQGIPQVVTEAGRVRFSNDGRSIRVGSVDELRVVAALREEGGVCERRRLHQLTAALGVSEPSFWRILNYSPLVMQVDRGVYGLIGSKPPPGLVEELQASTPMMTGGIVDRGWDNCNRLWIAYRLSTAAIETGIVGLPASVRANMSDSYELVDPVLIPNIMLRTNTQQIWGFRSTILELGAEAGDFMILFFDLPGRTVTIKVGDESTLNILRDT